MTIRPCLILRSACILTSVAGLACRSAIATPPPFTITSLAKTGNSVTGTGSTINSGTIFPPYGGRGFFNGQVNNSGFWLLDVDTQWDHNLGSTTHQSLIRTQTPLGPFSPYILQGTQGFLSVPTPTAVAMSFIQMSMNSAGDAALAMSWAPDDFSSTAGAGLFFNNNKVIFLEGDAVLTSGLAAGTIWNVPDAATRLTLTDTNKLLIVSTVNEGGIARRAVIVLQLDAAGNISSRTLIAKEGGPVGAGPATWAAIAGGPHAAAMNNAGTCVFSGATSTGVEGIYSTAGAGGFIATVGSPSPDAGSTWGSLLGASLDINTQGVVAYKGTTSNTTGTYTESSPDAGESMDFEDHTYGNGPLNLITGTLLNDQDADFFRITVTDANSFSATTVPDPGSGFPGANFDTVLTLISDPGETSSAGGRTQCDNVSPSILQSTITGAGGRAVSGRSYFLAISTPKSRIGKRAWHYATDTYPTIDGWYADPAAVAVSGGNVYWPDPSAETIRSVTTAGVAQPDLAIPTVFGHIAIDSAAGKIYWTDLSPGRIRRSNLDGSNPEDVIPASGVAPTNSSGTLYGDAVTGLAIDAVHGKLYWSRSIFGEINVANLDGSSPARVRWDSNHGNDNFPITIAISGTFAPGPLAIDTAAAGRVFFANTMNNRIERCDASGANRATVIAGANATAVAIDNAAGKIYWTNTAAGKIQRANLNGTSIEDVALSPLPSAITLDTAAGFVYWTNTLDRVIRRASIAGAFPAAPSDVVTLAPDTGERAPDGPARETSGYFTAWSRLGAPGTTVLPYQIKLTGAAFQFPRSIIARNNQKVAAVGDPVTGVTGSVITQLAPSGAPIKISDRGDVLWKGAFYPVIAQNVPDQGLFLNTDIILRGSQVLSAGNLASQRVIDIYGGPNSLHMSPNGQYAIVLANLQDPPYNFTIQRDNALLFEFTLPPSCRADFNASGTLTVQDIFDFLGAWFAGDPRADFNSVNGLGVQDIFDFLNAWFAGCP